MKKVIITGGLGYIGMELSKIYSGKTRKYDITVLDSQFYSERVSQLKRWGINFEQIDILDIENLEKHISGADLIFHLAGVTDVGTTKDDIDRNRDKLVRNVGIKGTQNIIKFSKDKVKIIFPSTHVVFEGLNKVNKNIKEEAEPKPILEYSKGKVKSEKDLINSNKDYVIVRLGSVYGNSYDSTRLNIMTNVFSKITAFDGKIKLFSGGNQLKSLVSVNDVARCLEFVGESKEIKNELFNCVNENLTVKQVANICKKINKNLEIIQTNDSVPNKGYSLSNKKIKSTGFKFLYTVDKSIEEMVDSWKNQELIYNNEKIEIGTDNFVDNRGIISNYYFDDTINMIGYVESKKETVRGNHYHPIQTQKCLLVKGKFISVTKDLMNPDAVIETRIINEGDLSIIPPHVSHTMVFLEDSIFLNLVNGEREHENYGLTHTIRDEIVDEEFSKTLISNYKSECRVCGSKNLKLYLSLGLSPLANNLLDSNNEKTEKFPLELNYCETCFNSQLSVVVPPEEMFTNYLYLSSTAESFRKHFEDFAYKLKNDLKLNKNSLLVDIGSNDGVFLQPLKNLEIKAIGVEPAKNVARVANKNKLKTLVGYFDKTLSKKIVKNYGKVDVVTAFNVFAHNDGLEEIVKNTSYILKKDGEFIFEVQYILDTLNDLTFDNVYHEHVNYWSLLSLTNFFDKFDLKIYKVELIDTHGGSLRVYTSNNQNKKIHKSVNQLLKLEKECKLDKLSTYLDFAEKVEKTKNRSLEMVKKIKLEKKKIIGYGAPAKATTILNYFGLTDKDFEFTIDDNELKQNKFIPGTGIQIKRIAEINPEEYDYVLVLAWNFFDLIKKNNKQHFKNSKFIKLK
jgi:nucleoside-diphosphate-sugar epimerase/2-polyprenyl-3-methyl-5-hydroxy-6-metoxy-1,4-benzoquinol methylase/dTDP-4-dehydrorhamnose 3,5-epimerase-like enzyme